MYQKPAFATQYSYHVYNRGVAKQPIFRDTNDYLRILSTFSFYLEKEIAQKYSTTTKEDLNKILSQTAKNPIVQINAYCLMLNHFHLIIKQLAENGISQFMSKTLNSYTRYFNTKHDRVGPIFQGDFKAVLIENDEQFSHLSRYIHLNPFIAEIIKSSANYRWSSYGQYLREEKNRLCTPIYSTSKEEYKKFVEDYASYAIDIARIKKLLIDI